MAVLERAARRAREKLYPALLQYDEHANHVFAMMHISMSQTHPEAVGHSLCEHPMLSNIIFDA
jgi:hypothetical protein